ncbi:MAG: hypothetical protein MHM6MM_004717 [Cercozoa sp. M6MM]
MASKATKLVGTGVVALAALGAVSSCIYTVEPGFRGVIYDLSRGVLPDVDDEGTRFIVPVLQQPTLMDVRTRPFSLPTQTQTKDLQQVKITIRILFRPEPEAVAYLLKEYNTTYDQKLLGTMVPDVVKSVVSQYLSDELMLNRDEISRAIKNQLVQRAGQYRLLLEDVAMTELAFMKDFQQSIERKQVQEQMAERSEYIVEMNKLEAEAVAIMAEGEADSARLVQEALNDAGNAYLRIKSIDVARDIALQMSQSKSVTWLPENSNILLAPK